MTWEQIILMLRAVSSAVWGFVLLRFALCMWRVLRGHPRHFDVLCSLFGAVGMMILGYNLRWIVAAESSSIYVGLYVFSILLGVMIPIVVSTYRESHDGG